MPEMMGVPTIIIIGLLIVVLFVLFFYVSRKNNVSAFAETKTNGTISNKTPSKITITKEYGKVSLAGVTFRNLDGSYRQTIIRRCAKILDGHMERDVYFHAEKEPQNKHDRNAVRVFVEESWQTASGDFKDKYLGVIGYFPKHVAEDIAIEFEHIEDEPILFLSDAEIFEFYDEKGKQKVGISFSLRASWHEYQVDEDPTAGHENN